MQRTLFGACTALVLSACGGGGGGGTPQDSGTNQPPVAQDLCTDTRHGQTVTLALNASDGDSGPGELSYELPNSSEDGSLLLVSEGWNGSVYEAVYQTAEGAPWGTHTISYKVTDAAGGSETGEVHVIVRPRIMPLGDSITAGKYDQYDNMGTGTAEPEIAGYRERLWNELQAAGYKVDFVGGVSNGPDSLADRDHEGHNGIRTQSWGDSYDDHYPDGGIREQVYGWLQSNPADLVLLHIGTNDLATNEPPAQVAPVISEILSQIDSWGASNNPVDVLLAKIIDFRSGNPEVAELNTQIATMVDGSRLVDQYNALRTNGQPDPALYADPADDANGLHPNQAGYEAMADAWFAKLEPLLTGARCPSSP